MSDFTHLHVHSHYSLLDGLGKIRPMLERAKELGMNSMALTDHGAMYGAIEFYRTALDVGIKPIIGLETYIAPGGLANKRGKSDTSPRHLTLLAKNITGYKNLIKLTTTAHLKGYYYRPRIDYDLLTQFKAGLIILSGCLNSDLSKAITENRQQDADRLLKWHIDTFGRENFYLEVQDHPHITTQKVVNDALFKFAHKFNLHTVATADSHYVDSDDAHAHDVLLCVQTGKTVDDKNRLNMLDDDFSLKSPAAMKQAWREHPEVIENTQRIADACSIDIELGVNKLPRFPLPKNKTAEAALAALCKKGLVERYKKKVPVAANDRLKYELGVIGKTGYASYFLIVADFVNEAKRRGILVGPGRGSAAGSLVSYLTKITNIDPLHYNLLFERFLNPERVSMPDIDLDFADDRRDEVIEYVREKYGSEHVAQIITFGTMAARASVRDAGRALGYPYAFCDQIAKAIPLMTDFESALQQSLELKEIYTSDPQARKLIDTARRLEGVCRHASTHAAGVVITDKPLTNYVPLQLSSTGQGEFDTVTQYAMGDVESLGLLKIDFLGLKNLTIIQNTIDRVKRRFKVNIDIDNLPLADKKAYQLLQAGQSTGVFQLESSGMKRYLKELQPTEFEDIISILALYRPGPMDSIPDFIAAKHGKKTITYLHPVLEPILEKTYGVIVTQDQVLEIAREFAGFTYAEADILRKAVGKKIKKMLDEQREKFVEGAIAHRQIDTQTAQKVWDFIEPFARYGFNRAHAACYAMIAFQTAYLKAHYPAEFMAALLTSDEGNIDRAAVEVAEALTLGLIILPPDINESFETFTVVAADDNKDSIRFGLGAIKNVGHNIVSELIRERKENGKYKDLGDLFARVDSKNLNRKSVESLSKAGAFDQLAERAQVLHNMEKLLNFNRALHRNQEAGQQGLFGSSKNVAPPRLVLDECPVSPKDERLAWEKELLGMYVSQHPLAELNDILQKTTTSINDLKNIKSQQSVRIAGVVSKIHQINTKTGQQMLFVTLEDMTGKVEVLVFPTLLTKSKDKWTVNGTLIVEGKVSDKDGDPKVLVDAVWPLTLETATNMSAKPKPHPVQKKSTTTTQIIIHLPRGFTRDNLQKLQQQLSKLHQSSGLPVSLLIPQNGTPMRLQTTFRIARNAHAIDKIRDIVGLESIKVG